MLTLGSIGAQKATCTVLSGGGICHDARLITMPLGVFINTAEESLHRMRKSTLEIRVIFSLHPELCEVHAPKNGLWLMTGLFSSPIFMARERELMA